QIQFPVFNSKDGSKAMDRACGPSWEPAAIPFLRSLDPLQKIKKRSHFSLRDRHARVRGAARENTEQSQFAKDLARAAGLGEHTRRTRSRRLRATRPSLLILMRGTVGSASTYVAPGACVRYRNELLTLRCFGQCTASPRHLLEDSYLQPY